MALERTQDPAQACQEMQRVARRGFIETSSPLGELLQPNPAHRWLVTVENGVLCFWHKPFCRAPFLHAARACWFADEAFRGTWEVRYRNLVCTQFYWEERFDCCVEEARPDDFDTNNLDQTAEAYLDQALNALRTLSVPLPLIRADLLEALRRRPEWAVAINAYGVCLWQEGRLEEARAAFCRAALYDPSQSLYAANSCLADDQRPALAWLPDETQVGGAL
jgi:hypothetical protein